MSTKTIFTTVNVKREITEESIRGLLCSAYEGGMSDWAAIAGQKLADGLTLEDFKEEDRGGTGKMTLDEYWPSYQLIPFVEGCDLYFVDQEDETTYTLNIEAIRKGLNLMAEKFPKHFNDFVEENGDAITGDVFLQCCLLGDVIYG